MAESPIKKQDGVTTWEQVNGDKYLVTGVDRNGKRFRITTESWPYARGINLWRGNKWLLRDGRRFKISTTLN